MICSVRIDVEGVPSRAWWTQVMNHSGHGPDDDDGKPTWQTDGCIKIANSRGVNDERTRHRPPSFAIPMTGTAKVLKRFAVSDVVVNNELKCRRYFSLVLVRLGLASSLSRSRSSSRFVWPQANKFETIYSNFRKQNKANKQDTIISSTGSRTMTNLPDRLVYLLVGEGVNVVVTTNIHAVVCRQLRCAARPEFGD
jgi:hypothetical protein